MSMARKCRIACTAPSTRTCPATVLNTPHQFEATNNPPASEVCGVCGKWPGDSIHTIGEMPYLVDPKLYVFDPLIRELPRLRSELSQECPF